MNIMKEVMRKTITKKDSVPQKLLIKSEKNNTIKTKKRPAEIIH